MTYLLIAFRVVTIMALFLFLVLKTGRRKIGELPVYDFLSIIVIGSVIGADISEPDTPHLPTAFAVVLIIALQYFVSRLLINNKKIARKITFGPTVIIQDGQFMKYNMERLKYSLENVLMALREKDIFDLNEVAFAIVEGSGNISVLKKAQHLPLTPFDMSMAAPGKGLSVPLIADGNIYDGNLEQLKLSRQWLTEQLAQAGIHDVSEVFYAELNSTGKLYISRVLQTQSSYDRFTL